MKSHFQKNVQAHHSEDAVSCQAKTSGFQGLPKQGNTDKPHQMGGCKETGAHNADPHFFPTVLSTVNHLSTTVSFVEHLEKQTFIFYSYSKDVIEHSNLNETSGSGGL